MLIKILIILLLVIFLFGFSCISFKYMYVERSKALVEGINIDCSLNIAELKLKEGGFDSILTLWTLRDQFITEAQAERINGIYLKYIDTVKNEFGIWHISWAVANFYRLGDDAIKLKLNDSYENAVKQPDKLKQLKDIASTFITGPKIYYGFIHDLGKSYAHSHLIVPGNKEYLQSIEEFLEKNKNDKKLLNAISGEEWLIKCKANLTK